LDSDILDNDLQYDHHYDNYHVHSCDHRERHAKSREKTMGERKEASYLERGINTRRLPAQPPPAGRLLVNHIITDNKNGKENERRK